MAGKVSFGKRKCKHAGRHIVPGGKFADANASIDVKRDSGRVGAAHSRVKHEESQAKLNGLNRIYGGEKLAKVERVLERRATF